MTVAAMVQLAERLRDLWSYRASVGADRTELATYEQAHANLLRAAADETSTFEAENLAAHHRSLPG